MNNQVKILLGLLVLAALGLAYTLFSGNTTPEPTPEPDRIEKPVKEKDPADITPPNAGTSKPDSEDNPSVREPVREKVENATGAGESYAQGVRGIVVDESHAPVQGAKVYLMPGLGFDTMRMFKQHQQGVTFPPLAETETNERGEFRLGLKKYVENKKYELKVLHETFCDASMPNLDPQPGDWAEVGPIQLKRGVVVFGRVTTETGMPIPDATVAALDNGGILNITPAPGRENGIMARTNASGEYELPPLDPSTSMTITARAPKFAKEEKPEVQLGAGGRVQVDFQLEPGLDIAGVTVDAQGKPVARAKITIAALSQKSRFQDTTFSDEEGNFRAVGLKGGIYALVIDADGNLSVDEKPVPAGKTDLTITLERQGRVIIHVVDQSGRPIPKFTCRLKPAFEDSNQYGMAQHTQEGRSGKLEMTGVNPMTWVAEVHASGFAKNFSERFKIAPGQQAPPEVTVKLNLGGEIFGIVTDANGKPLKGVKVKTMPNELVENPFILMFPVPYTITRGEMTTGNNGEFRFKMLYPSTYQLKFAHPDYVSLFRKDVTVDLGQAADLGNVQLDPGCLLSGMATYEGKPCGQVKVNITAVTDDKSTFPFSSEAITDNEGLFLIPKRLSPGKYTVMAARQTTKNPLLQMVEFNKSKTEFTIPKGRETFQLRIDIPKLQ